MEDSALVTDALSILLEGPGRHVSIAHTVAEALAIGRDEPAALVLVDLTLPDGDGLTVVEPLRTAGSRRFVALTGHDDPATMERCRRAGCADVIIKPIGVRDFVAKVDAWLGSDPV